MTITVPNIQVPVIDDKQRMTPQFLKFLGELAQQAPGSVEAEVATLQSQVAALQTAVTTLAAQIVTIVTALTAQGTHLSLLPASRLTGSAAYDPPNLIPTATTTTTVTVASATLGMAAEASFSLDITGLIMTAYVSSANTVTVVLQNPTAGAINIGNGTLTAYAWNP